MTKVAQAMLVLTCLAPICFVQAAVAVGRRQGCVAAVLAIAVAALVAACLALLWGAARAMAPVPKKVGDLTAMDSEPLAFLVAYALPLASPEVSGANLLGLGAFALVMGAVLWQLRIFHVNPVLALFGYRFFAAKSDGASVLVLSRRRLIAGGELPVIRLTESLWLYCGGDSEDGRERVECGIDSRRTA
jgi:hypothetical protein